MAESPLNSAEALYVGEFGKYERIRLQEIKENFMLKGSFGVWWDGKVSEDERKTWWYLYLFTFRSSDKATVMREIDKIIKLYEAIEKLSSLTYDEIEKLDEDVKDVVKNAKKIMGSSRSKTVYKACQELVSSKIDEKISKIKSQVGTYEYKKLRANFENVVKAEVRRSTQVYREEMDSLKIENERARETRIEMEANFMAQMQQLFSRIQDLEEKGKP